MTSSGAAFSCELGDPQWSREPHFSNMTTRAIDIDKVYAKLAELLLERSNADWLELFRRAQIPPWNWPRPNSS